MAPEDQQTFTYRGRSLEELVPRIRQELGDDAVIVARRETSSGGVGGFFAKREIEVEVRAGESAPAGGPSPAAFAAQLADAQQRQQQGGSDVRPATSPEIDALPSSTDVTVDDLFPPAPPAQAQGLAALFNAGLPPQAAADAEVAEAASAPEEEPVARREIIEDDEEWEDEDDDDAGAPPEAAAGEPEAVEPEAVEQPTGMFDYLGIDPLSPTAAGPELTDPEPFEPPAAPAPEPAAVVAPEPAVAEPVAAEPVAAEPADVEPADAEPALPVTPAPAPVTALPHAAVVTAERLADRGLRPGLAEAIAEEAIAALAPLMPDADPKELVVDALARRIPMHPLRRGPGVIGFVGPGGAGKTRCVARLAAAHARHGLLPVTVIALRSPDGGAELRRLLAPYGVALHAIESGAEGAGHIAELRGSGLVIVDTPGVSPRSTGELHALGSELDALAPDELHLAVPATISPASAQELVGGVRELGVGALVLTHTDETEMLGTVIGLAIDSGLPLSFLARGQAVEAGLRPASATELARDLVP
jgi:flagellar biosynthesis GTPase FlhF